MSDIPGFLRDVAILLAGGTLCFYAYEGASKRTRFVNLIIILEAITVVAIGGYLVASRLY